jgi:hypothetical protein
MTLPWSKGYVDGPNCGRKLEYRCISRFEVQHLEIVEDLLDEDQMMATTMGQGWALALVFGVGQSDEDAT